MPLETWISGHILNPLPHPVYPLLFFKKCLFNFKERETEHEQGRGREREGHRIQSRLQALSCQHRARRRAQTHRLQDHDLSRSRTLNQQSHPGAPKRTYFLSKFYAQCGARTHNPEIKSHIFFFLRVACSTKLARCPKRTFLDDD